MRFIKIFMRAPKTRPSLAWGILVSIVFLILLAIRLDIFTKDNEKANIAQKAEIQRPAESWMNIYQKDKKIGVIHRQFIIMETGKMQTTENVTMQIATLGTTQVLHLKMEADLNPDMSFSSFNFEINSSLFSFKAHGFRTDDKLILFTGQPSSQQKSEIPLKDIPYVGGNIYEAAFSAGLKKDASRDFTIFDPSTTGIRKIKVTRDNDEIIPIMGKRVLTQKFCADFMGAKNCAWLSSEGEVIKETGLLGLSMEKVSPQKASENMPMVADVDFTQIASVESNVKINEPGKLKELKIKIDGIRNTPLFLNGGRQVFAQRILTITKENLSESVTQQYDLQENTRRYLEPSPLVQSDHEQIKTQAQKIVRPSDNHLQKTEKIVKWVYANIKKAPVLSVPNALEVLNNKMGDCNEHAVLTAALLRAAGVPAQIEAGLVYQNGRFYYHAWNLAYAGNWITVDSVFNQIPADVTHIRLTRGEGGIQLDLLGVMGKIKLEVLSTKYD
jgi:hypothetical protein